MGLRFTSGVCDRGGCPAPATREFLVHSGDFRFCNHHAVELLAGDLGDVLVEITQAHVPAPAAVHRVAHGPLVSASTVP